MFKAIIEASVRFRWFVVIAVSLVAALGLFELTKLPIDAVPDITNRQVQMGRKALYLPGDTRDDLWIIVEIAKRLGLKWTYTHPAEVFAEMKLAMPSLENITWERLERESSIIYPCPEPDHPGDAAGGGDGDRERARHCLFLPLANSETARRVALQG